MFNHDWFHGQPFEQQKDEAKWRCVLRRFPDLDLHVADEDQSPQHQEAKQFGAELEVRALMYLRDGFSYEIKQLAEVSSKSHLVFECEPLDEQYKVGSFIVTVPFDEIARVEVFAVHPSEKPEDMPQITGFKSPAEPPESKHTDTKPVKKGR